MMESSVMADTPEYRLQMRIEWNALRDSLVDCVERHIQRQEQLIAALENGQMPESEMKMPESEMRIADAPSVPDKMHEYRDTQDYGMSAQRINELTAALRDEEEQDQNQDESGDPKAALEPTAEAGESNGPDGSSPHPKWAPKAADDGTISGGSPRSPRSSPDPRSPRAPSKASKTPSVASSRVQESWEDQSMKGVKGAIARTFKKRCFRLFNWWMELKEPRRTGRLARLVHSPLFECITSAVIVANGIFALIAANIEEESALRGEASDRTVLIFSGEIFFLCFYCIELVLKLKCHGLYFFVNDDMNWNFFDTILVVFTLYDELCQVIFDERMGANLVFVRVLRICKVAKILRVVRVMKYFSELRLILTSLVGSMVNLFWSIMMIMLIFYIFSLCFVNGFTTHLVETFDEMGEEDLEAITEHWGSVQQAMLTLFMSTTGGNDWAEYYGIVLLTGRWYSWLYLFFIAFIQIALFNILTSVFVENAMKLAAPDRDAKALELRKAEVAEKEELRKICKELDVNNDGSLDVWEFHHHLSHGKLKAYLGVLGLDVRDAEVFLKVLSSATQDAPIDIEAFVDGCMRMKGLATSIDMQGLMFETKIIHKENRSFQREIMDRVGDLSSGVNALNTKGVRPRVSAKALNARARDLPTGIKNLNGNGTGAREQDVARGVKASNGDKEPTLSQTAPTSVKTWNYSRPGKTILNGDGKAAEEQDLASGVKTLNGNGEGGRETEAASEVLEKVTSEKKASVAASEYWDGHTDNEHTNESGNIETPSTCERWNAEDPSDVSRSCSAAPELRPVRKRFQRPESRRIDAIDNFISESTRSSGAVALSGIGKLNRSQRRAASRSQTAEQVTQDINGAVYSPSSRNDMEQRVASDREGLLDAAAAESGDY